jgi:hypothetical protein
MSKGQDYEVAEEEMIEIRQPEDIPAFVNEDEEDAFWTTHYFGDEYVKRVGLIPSERGPAARLRRMAAKTRPQ